MAEPNDKRPSEEDRGSVPSDEEAPTEEEIVPSELAETVEDTVPPSETRSAGEQDALPSEPRPATGQQTAPPEPAAGAQQDTLPSDAAGTAAEATLPSGAAGASELDTLPGDLAEKAKTLLDVWEGTIRATDTPEVTVKSGRGSVGETETMQAADAAHMLGKEIADFEIFDLIGSGGMGVVYRARQKSLDRDVALKTFKRFADKKKEETIRGPFVAEAVVTGQLDHPNIVPIHTLERDAEGKSFYTMKRVVGRSWKDCMGEMTLQQNLEVLLRVGDAVSFAHSRGVIHRDLKPSNVMLGDYGEVIVMDWGLAASVESQGKAENIRYTSQVGGTPAYMAPEMARDERRKIGKRSDVYLLGGILFQIVTGLTPHIGKTAIHCVTRAAENEIQATEKSGELLDIAYEAMSTRPGDRHRSVAEFQEGVRQYMAHAESIALVQSARGLLNEGRQTRAYDTFARAIFAFEEALNLWTENVRAQQGLRDARLAYAQVAYAGGDYDLALSVLEGEQTEQSAQLRQRVLLAREERLRKVRAVRTLKIGIAALAAALIIGLTIGFLWIRWERDKTEVAIQLAESEGYSARVGLAAKKIEVLHFEEAERLLDGCPPRLRHWGWGLLKRICHGDLLTFRGHAIGVGAVAVSPDGKLIASGGADGAIKLWETDSGRELVALERHTDVICGLSFSPDGARLASASDDGTVKVWDTASGSELATLQGHEDEVWCVAFSPDGKWLASGGKDRTVRIWDPSDLVMRVAIKGFGADVTCLAFSSAGKLAVGFGKLGDFGQLAVVEVGSWQQLHTISAHADRVQAVAFSPDGRMMVSGAFNGRVRLWDVADGQELHRIKGYHTGAVFSVAFSPDGERVASGGEDHTIRIWDSLAGDWLNTLKGHSDLVGAVAFLPDGVRLVSGSRDQTVKVWDFQKTDRVSVTLSGHSEFVYTVAFSPRGDLAASGSRDGTVKLWNVQTGKNVVTLDADADAANAVAFSPDGRTLAVAYRQKVVVLWDVDSLDIRATLEGHEDVVACVAFSRDGARVASGSSDGTVKLWDPGSGAHLRTFGPGGAAISAVAFCPDGRRIAAASLDDRCVYVWDVETGAELATLSGHSEWVRSVAFSPDGRLIASGGNDNVIKLWDATTYEELGTLKGHKMWVKTVAFSPDGRRLASGGDDGTVRLWDPATGREVVSLPAHTKPVWSVAFSPDGLTIASASGDCTVKLWRAWDWSEPTVAQGPAR